MAGEAGQDAPEQRRESRADGQRQAAAIRNIADRQSDERIGAPGGKSPMQKGVDIGWPNRFLRQRLDRAADDVGIVREMRERLPGGIGQHADADARAEQHREP